MNKKIGNFYFERSNGERLLLAENVNREGAFKIMNEFLDDHKFKSHYVRSWQQDNELWFDVGSWSEFFVLICEGGQL